MKYRVFSLASDTAVSVLNKFFDKYQILEIRALTIVLLLVKYQE